MKQYEQKYGICDKYNRQFGPKCRRVSADTICTAVSAHHEIFDLAFL